MALQAMWAHGHAAAIEFNNSTRGAGQDIRKRKWTAVVGLHVGSGVEYRCEDNSSYTFHFAIPTAVIDDGVRARLRRVMVLFTAGRGVTLSSVQVWDGPNQVFTRDGLAIGEANVSLVEERNSFVLPDLEVLWGIGVSVRFHFADAGNVTLHSAGIDFEVQRLQGKR